MILNFFPENALGDGPKDSRISLIEISRIDYYFEINLNFITISRLRIAINVNEQQT